MTKAPTDNATDTLGEIMHAVLGQRDSAKDKQMGTTPQYTKTGAVNSALSIQVRSLNFFLQGS